MSRFKPHAGFQKCGHVILSREYLLVDELDEDEALETFRDMLRRWRF